MIEIEMLNAEKKENSMKDFLENFIMVRKYNTPKGNKTSGNEYQIYLFRKFIFAIDRRK